MRAILKITDGTKEVSLLNFNGYHIDSWRPKIATYKGGGNFRDSPNAHGRRLVQKLWEQPIESINLKARGNDTDVLIRESQKLRRLLEKASDYWTSKWQNSPVWIEAKASKETNTRYAIIHVSRIPEDENPMSAPFLQPDCSAVMDNITLFAERGHWREVSPGERVCVEASGLQDTWSLPTTAYVPTAQTDDAYIGSLGGIDTAGTALRFGFTNVLPQTAYTTGVRFRNVTVPNGATIARAYIRFMSTNAQGGYTKAFVYGERNAAPAAFSTWANFTARIHTSAMVEWFELSSIPSWTGAEIYDTPDITSVVQEIVDLGGWAFGNDMVLFVEGDDIWHGIREPASFDHAIYTEP